MYPPSWLDQRSPPKSQPSSALPNRTACTPSVVGNVPVWPISSGTGSGVKVRPASLLWASRRHPDGHGPPTPPSTTKVRVLVAVTDSGSFPSQGGPDGALMVVSGAVDVGTGAGTMLRETVGVESATGALSSRRKPAPAAVPATARTATAVAADATAARRRRRREAPACTRSRGTSEVGRSRRSLVSRSRSSRSSGSMTASLRGRPGRRASPGCAAGPRPSRSGS